MTIPLSTPEQNLMQEMGDEQLRVSLLQLRTAAEAIWSPGTPRIVQDYTDHSLHHSVRLIGYAEKLLRANAGQELSSQEMYLLLGGAYLHDVGLQCDVIHFPEVMVEAERLGAKFDVEFSSTRSSTFSVAEQKAIRRNHQFLSAGWILSSRLTGKPPLGPSTASVPMQLVRDLADVCLHHSTLPIMRCARNFELSNQGRKRLVAALVRFADELDIDAARVDVSTIETFRLDAANAIYWWLHHHTLIEFISPSLVSITIAIHPEDIDNRADKIKRAFIDAFKRKNDDTLTALAQDGVPIYIGSMSQVTPYAYADRLPPSIAAALDAM